MTELDTLILSKLASANALTTAEIADAIGAGRYAAQKALHQLDDAGHVILRNGFYRLSEAARAAMNAEPMTRPGDVIHE